MSTANDPPPNPGTSHASLREIKAAGKRWGLDEFVAVVNGLIERYLPASRSFNVKLSGVFNPRLVRYYATFGLISPPEREGKEARYHYGHLLQALVIRRLLFEGYTAPALLKMLAGKKEADYEAMLAGGVSTAAAAVPRDELNAHIDAAGPAEHLRLVGDVMTAMLPPAPEVVPAPAPVDPSQTLLWRRVKVAPGLELHIRTDFVVPDTRARREAFLLAVLGSLQPGSRS